VSLDAAAKELGDGVRDGICVSDRLALRAPVLEGAEYQSELVT
jgi:hypothetical protein